MTSNKKNWIPFDDQVSYKHSLIMHKVRNTFVPAYLKTFTPLIFIHDHNTRCAARGGLYV